MVSPCRLEYPLYHMQPCFTPDAYTHANSHPRTSSVDRCSGLSCGELPPVEGTAPLLEGRQKHGHVHVYICVCVCCWLDVSNTHMFAAFPEEPGLALGATWEPPSSRGTCTPSFNTSFNTNTQRKRTRGGDCGVCVRLHVCVHQVHT